MKHVCNEYPFVECGRALLGRLASHSAPFLLLPQYGVKVNTMDKQDGQSMHTLLCAQFSSGLESRNLCASAFLPAASRFWLGVQASGFPLELSGRGEVERREENLSTFVTRGAQESMYCHFSPPPPSLKLKTGSGEEGRERKQTGMEEHTDWIDKPYRSETIKDGHK